MALGMGSYGYGSYGLGGFGASYVPVHAGSGYGSGGIGHGGFCKLFNYGFMFIVHAMQRVFANSPSVAICILASERKIVCGQLNLDYINPHYEWTFPSLSIG